MQENVTGDFGTPIRYYQGNTGLSTAMIVTLVVIGIISYVAVTVSHPNPETLEGIL
jgi:hypothetical protein